MNLIRSSGVGHQEELASLGLDHLGRLGPGQQPASQYDSILGPGPCPLPLPLPSPLLPPQKRNVLLIANHKLSLGTFLIHSCTIFFWGGGSFLTSFCPSPASATAGDGFSWRQVSGMEATISRRNLWPSTSLWALGQVYQKPCNVDSYNTVQAVGGSTQLAQHACQ